MMIRHFLRSMTLNYFIFFLLFTAVFANETLVLKKNTLLLRNKRYLSFPASSNFQVSMAFVSNFQIVQPQGWKMLVECDYPFALPSDTRLFKFHKLVRRSSVERNEILSGLESALSRIGLNGTACLNQMICHSKRFGLTKGKSLVQDMLHTIFESEQEDFKIDYENVCSPSNFQECPIPLLDLIVNSMTKNTHQ